MTTRLAVFSFVMAAALALGQVHPRIGPPRSCGASASPVSFSFGAEGGLANVQVTPNESGNCFWWMSSDVPWISLGPSARGPAALQLPVPPNPGTQARTARVSLGGTVVTIVQAGNLASCAYTVGSDAVTLPAEGGTVPLAVGASSGACRWAVSGGAEWITQAVGTGYQGSGTVLVTAGPTTRNFSRLASLYVAGQWLTIRQAGLGEGPLTFVRMTPCRVMETRPEYNSDGHAGPFGPPALAAFQTRTLALGQSKCAVPASARVYVLNVTVIPRGGPVERVQVSTAGRISSEMTVTSPDAQIVANTAFVQAGDGGTVEVLSWNETDLVIDITGYFTDDRAVSNMVFYPLTPCRVVETRSAYRGAAGEFGPPALEAGQTRRFRIPENPYCRVPRGAAAYSLNLTVVPTGPLPFVTAWPSDQPRPVVSSINSLGGRVLTNNIILPAAADGSISLYGYAGTDVLLDLNGYFAPDDGSNGLFYRAVTPCEVSNTTAIYLSGPYGGPAMAAETARTLPVIQAPRCTGIPGTAKAYALQVTALPGGNPLPFVTLYPSPAFADPLGLARPGASVLNAFEGQTVTNFAIVPAGAGGAVNAYAYRRTDLKVSIVGLFSR